MNMSIRAVIAAVAFAGLTMSILTSLGHASPLSNCYDRVIAACNKKPDHAVNACVSSGLDQCDGQFTSGGSKSEAPNLRASAMSKLKAAPAKRP